MMTRRATAKDMEVKLKQVLMDLETSRELSNHLLQEREDSEAEILKTVTRNTQLKNELVELHLKYNNLLVEYSHTVKCVESFKECSDTHERALSRINELESDLFLAQKTISQLENSNKDFSSEINSQSLFHELQQSDLSLSLTEESVIINNRSRVHMSSDLYNEINPSTSLKNVTASVAIGSRRNSVKKIKKYIKINRYIARTNKLIRKRQSLFNNAKRSSERIQLLEKLESLSNIISENRLIYENNIAQFKLKTTKLHNSLTKMTGMYEGLKKEIKEYILALKCITTEGERNQHKQCYSPQPFNSSTHSAHTPHLSSNSEPLKTNSVIFSDGLGKGLGSTLRNSLNQNLQNICSPGRSFCSIVENMGQHVKNGITNVTLLCGDSNAVNKKDIIKSIDTIIHLQAKLNYVNHFIRYFKLTPSTVYLSKKYRTLLASLLAHNIDDAIARLPRPSNIIQIKNSLSANSMLPDTNLN
ncbi:hypothetical protein ACJJTC_006247 [Scirpophaga incertulas]